VSDISAAWLDVSTIQLPFVLDISAVWLRCISQTGYISHVAACWIYQTFGLATIWLPFVPDISAIQAGYINYMAAICVDISALWLPDRH